MLEIKFLTDAKGNMFAMCDNKITLSIQGEGDSKAFLVAKESEVGFNVIKVEANNHMLLELFKKFIDGLEEK